MCDNFPLVGEGGALNKIPLVVGPVPTLPWWLDVCSLFSGVVTFH